LTLPAQTILTPRPSCLLILGIHYMEGIWPMPSRGFGAGCSRYGSMLEVAVKVGLSVRVAVAVCVWLGPIGDFRVGVIEAVHIAVDVIEGSLVDDAVGVTRGSDIAVAVRVALTVLVIMLVGDAVMDGVVAVAVRATPPPRSSTS
jgi:hypothetical protein